MYLPLTLRQIHNVPFLKKPVFCPYYRFHVLCSHLLCEVPVDSFDPKMNMENLTKCLQSLKEFYRDLRVDKVRSLNDIGFACISVYTCMYMFTLAELGLDPFTLYVFMLISVECPCVCTM